MLPRRTKQEEGKESANVINAGETFCKLAMKVNV